MSINLSFLIFFLFFFSHSLADLDHALSCLAREDPSLRVSVNHDSGQTVLSGMGELHLEIIHDRLRRDFGVDCSLGKLQVSYKECPTKDVTQEGTKGSIYMRCFGVLLWHYIGKVFWPFAADFCLFCLLFFLTPINL